MAFPPFQVDEEPGPGEAVMRAVDGSEVGTTLNRRPKPHAEMRITYRTQFQFHRIWEIKGDTPIWPGDWPAAELKDLIGVGTPEWLTAGDRIVQYNYDDKAVAKVGGRRMKLILGESESTRSRFWVPIDSVLPKLATPGTEGWKWVPPKRVNPIDNQWGIRGDLTVVTDPWGEPGEPMDYHMVTVWQRWEFGRLKGQKKYGLDMCTLPPGTYAGFVRQMGNASATRAEREGFPAIQVGFTWDPQDEQEPAPATTNGARPRPARRDPNRQGPWVQGVTGWTLKNPQSTSRTTSICVHPGNTPQWFLGCLAPGPMDRQREWGFAEKSDTERAMFEILAAVGIAREAYVRDNTFLSPSKNLRKWFLIRVEAENQDAISTDGWQRQSLWLDRQPAELVNQ